MLLANEQIVFERGVFKKGDRVVNAVLEGGREKNPGY